MKWRIVLTVVFVLTLFAGFAYLYVNAFVRKHQHAVILFVVDGLDLNTLNLARQQFIRNHPRLDLDDPAIGDARRRAGSHDVLNLDSFWNVALLSLQDPGQPVPDAGADATAIACGQRVPNGNVAFGHDKLQSLIYIAEQDQRATGLVTTSSLVDPVPVAFYSTTLGAPDPYRNASELLYGHINIILGGGEEYFTPANATNELGRRDGRNLLDEAKGKDFGYTVIRNRDELTHVSVWDAVSPWRPRQILGIFAPGQFYFSSLQPENRRQPSLAEMTRTAISALNSNYNGYFLVVQHGLVARAGERNFGKLALNEAAEVDEAIESAVEYAGPDALIIVTNSYSLGSVGPLPPPTAADMVISPPTVDAAGKPVKASAVPINPPPPPAWLAGPGGPTVARSQAAWLHQQYEDGTFQANASGFLVPEPALRFQTKAEPLAEPAWLASRGEGSSQFRGFISNTDVFDLVSEQF